MQLAVRSSLAAGAAFVGAGAIALSPIAPVPADITTKAAQPNAVSAEYTPTGLAQAIVALAQGQAQAINHGLVGFAAGVREGLLTTADITDTAAGTALGVNNTLTATGLSALAAVAANPFNPASYLSAGAALVQGGSTALNQSLAGSASAVNLGLGGLDALVGIGTGTAYAINNSLTGAFLTGLNELFPGNTVPDALAALYGLPGPSTVAAAFADLLEGGSDALNQLFNGFAIAVADGVLGAQEITDTISGTLLTINTGLTQAALAAGQTIAADPFDPAAYAAAFATLVGGFSQAVNDSLVGLAGVATAGLDTLTALTGDFAATLLAVNTRLTDAFISAIERFAPPAEDDEAEANVLAAAAVDLDVRVGDVVLSPERFLAAFTDLVQGGSTAVNQALAGFADGVAIGLDGIANTVNTAAGTALAINSTLVAAGLTALEAVAANPFNPANYVAAFAALVQGGSTALNQGLAGIAQGITGGLDTLADLTDKAAGTALGIDTTLTNAFTDALGRFVDAPEEGPELNSISGARESRAALVAATTTDTTGPTVQLSVTADTKADEQPAPERRPATEDGTDTEAGAGSAVQDARAERQAAREAAKAEREAAREAAKAERQAARESAKAEREAAKAERQAAREAAKAERQAAKTDTASKPAGADRDSAKPGKRSNSGSND